MQYLMDTNICIDLLRGKDGIVAAIDQVGDENCFISEITKAELLVGAAISEANGYSRNARSVRDFLEAVSIVPISDSLELYAEEKARLRMEGQTIEDFDLMIGCTAVVHGMTMVSGNAEHIGRIKGIRLVDWTAKC